MMVENINMLPGKMIFRSKTNFCGIAGTEYTYSTCRDHFGVIKNHFIAFL